MNKTRCFNGALCAVSCGLMMTASLSATADSVWTGAADACWTNAANWANGEVPGRYYAPDGTLTGTKEMTATFGACSGVVEIDLRETGWTNLKRDIFEAAANRGDVTIVIYYRQWGQDHTLTIPAGTQLNDVVSQAQYLDVTQLGTLLNLRAV